MLKDRNEKPRELLNLNTDPEWQKVVEEAGRIYDELVAPAKPTLIEEVDALLWRHYTGHISTHDCRDAVIRIVRGEDGK